VDSLKTSAERTADNARVWSVAAKEKYSIDLPTNKIIDKLRSMFSTHLYFALFLSRRFNASPFIDHIFHSLLTF
jgi:hypothetical protein